MSLLQPAEWRTRLGHWWQSLDAGKKLFIAICGLNVLVSCAWRIPTLRLTLFRYFTADPKSSVIYWPMLLATFSHYFVPHLAINMYVLKIYISPVVATLGKVQFLALYLTSGVIGTLASYFFKTMISQSGYSLGASGAIMGVCSFRYTQYPDEQLSLIYFSTITYTASMLLKVLVGIDALGCVMGWRVFDHAAHLGGAACGIFWQKWHNTSV